MAQDKSDKQLIVLKVGTSTLTRETNQISRGKLEDIGRQILQLKDRYDFILVCSGAIAVAKQFVSLDGGQQIDCLLYTSPSPRDATLSRMPSSA